MWRRLTHVSVLLHVQAWDTAQSLGDDIHGQGRRGSMVTQSVVQCSVARRHVLRRGRGANVIVRPQTLCVNGLAL